MKTLAGVLSLAQGGTLLFTRISVLNADWLTFWCFPTPLSMRVPT